MKPILAGAGPSLHPATREIGDRWIDSLQSGVLAVPSAVVIGEVNYIVNPGRISQSSSRVRSRITACGA